MNFKKQGIFCLIALVVSGFLTFTGIVSASSPTITSITPATTTTAGGDSIVIAGTDFATSTVTIGGNSATVTASSTTSLTVTVPATSTAGLANVVILNEDAGTVSTSTAFTYISVPTISSISPATGTASGGTYITITGTQFATGAIVTIGGATASSTFLNSTTIAVTTAATSTAGQAHIVVLNADAGTVSTTTAFTYISAPTITNISPATGTASGGTYITITGTQFATGAVVRVGGSIASSTFLNSTTIAVTTAATSTTGLANILVTNLDTGYVSNSTSFTYLATLSNLTISSGTLSPTFSSNTNSYSVTVPTGITSVTVTPTATQGGSTITVNDVVVTSGSASGAISLNVGSNTITIKDSISSSSTNNYIITVNRAGHRIISVTDGGTSSGAEATVVATTTASTTSTSTSTTSSSTTVSLTSPSTISLGYVFTKDLTIGSKGADVTALQQLLINEGHLTMPTGTAYGYFGALTKLAVIKYQKAKGIAPAAGYVGPKTRDILNNTQSSTTGASQDVSSMTLKQLLQMLLQIGAIASDKIDAANKLINSL